MRKKLMILGAGVYQMPLIEEAIKQCEVLLVAPKIEEEIKKLVDYYFLCDVTKKESILEIAKKEKIDGIITDQTDIAVRTVAYVAEKLNLSGIGYETACLFTNKFLMREKCDQLGIPTLPYKLVKTLEEAIAFYNEIGKGKVIIKPVDNQGSRGVQQIESEQELCQKFHETRKYSNNSILIEKMATGQEFVMESLCIDGKYYPLICGDTNYFSIKDAFAAKTRIFPSNADSKLMERVKELNQKIITGFGLKQGISHSEYIMEQDEIYLIETAARGGGVFISSDLISLGTGLNTEKFLIAMALGEQKEVPSLSYDKNTCGYMAFFLPKGEVISVQGIEEVLSLPFVHRNLLRNIKIGTKTEFHLDKTARYCMIVSAKNLKELEERMDKIKNLLKIEVFDGENIKEIIWE